MQQGRTIVRPCLRSIVYYALPACATTAANACGSRTARSASILRLSVMFGFLQRGHQPAVGGAVQAGRGVDAGDPQLAQVALADAAIAGGVPQALQHGFVGALEQQVLRAALALRDLQNFLVTKMPVWATFYTAFLYLLQTPGRRRVDPHASCVHPKAANKNGYDRLGPKSLTFHVRREALDALDDARDPSRGSSRSSSALVRFEVRRRRWLLPPLVRTSMPDPVRRNRLEVALWVFSLICQTFCFARHCCLLLSRKNITAGRDVLPRDIELSCGDVT